MLNLFKKKQPVIILAKQRSGTNFLRLLLNKTNQYADYNEIFHPAGQINEHNFYNFRTRLLSKQPELSIPSYENNKNLFSQYLKHLNKLTEGERNYIIDIKYNSLWNLNTFWSDRHDIPMLLTIAKHLNVPIIHLIRENIFENYISTQRAMKTDEWIANNNINKKDNIQLKIDTEHMVNELKNRSEEIQFINSSLHYGNASYVNIIYEKLTANGINEAYLKEKLKEIALDIPEIKQLSTKKIINNIENLIINIDEVKQALQEHGYERFLKA